MKKAKRRISAKVETVYECEYCGEEFDNSARASWHEESCTTTICPKCGYSFHGYHSLNVFFSDEIGFVAACPKCILKAMQAGEVGRLVSIPSRLVATKADEIETYIKKLRHTEPLPQNLPKNGYILHGKGVVVRSTDKRKNDKSDKVYVSANGNNEQSIPDDFHEVRERIAMMAEMNGLQRNATRAASALLSIGCTSLDELGGSDLAELKRKLKFVDGVGSKTIELIENVWDEIRK